MNEIEKLVLLNKQLGNQLFIYPKSGESIRVWAQRFADERSILRDHPPRPENVDKLVNNGIYHGMELGCSMITRLKAIEKAKEVCSEQSIPEKDWIAVDTKIYFTHESHLIQFKLVWEPPQRNGLFFSTLSTGFPLITNRVININTP